jgi:two-component system chemotaxis response regulator CheY
MKDNIRKQLLEQIGDRKSQRKNDISKATTVAAKKSSSILIIDDEPSCLELARAVLESKGYLIYSAGTVSEGRALWQAHCAISLIITDLKMPREDGFALLEFIAANYRFHHIPILVLTCCADREIVCRAIELGASDYLIKPFTPALLLERVEKLYSKPRGSILIVSDNTASIAILRRTLTAHGYRIFEASSGAMAKDIINREEIDVGISELALVDMSGFELLIYAHDRENIFPFIFISDPILALSVEDIRSTGGFGLLTMPFNNTEVLSAVRQAICKKKGMRD